MPLFDPAARIFRVEQPDPVYISDCFPEQRAFIVDGAKRKCALAGRRGGKTWGVALWLIDGALSCRGEMSVFIARTAGHARRILWGTLKRINGKYKLGFRFNEQLLYAIAPNGHTLWLTGAKDSSDIEKLRGDRYYRIAIDEAGSFGPALLSYLIDDILDPALMDLDGDLALVGNPGLVPMGAFFENSTEGPGSWPTHRWTCLNNPHVKGANYLARKLKQNRWTEKHPTYRREYLGEWILDLEALVYPYNPDINRWFEMPEGDIYWGIAVDPGAGEAEPSTGFCVGFVRRNHPELYIRRGFKLPSMTPNKIAARIGVLQEEYTPGWGSVGPMVLDEGALGRGYGDQLRDEGIGIVAAQKSKKLAYQERFRGRLQSGMVKVYHDGSRGPQPCDDLTDEWNCVRRDPKTGKDDPAFPNHCSDAALYLDRALGAYYRPEIEPPTEGTAEWFKLQTEKHKEELRRKIARENRRKWRHGKPREGAWGKL